ncbi:hypothetical protein [Polaromonas sp.]|uniref:hypothetical protein n=1 Tax=Polaromonas sp. TaxID=1869339 RepID=UPI003529DB93
MFEKMRDRIMLPFPCIQTNVPIYGGNSGGPLFDERGRICAVHCTSFGGNDIAFHVPIKGVFTLRARAESLKVRQTGRKNISILELALSRQVFFDPPMLNAERPIHSRLRWFLYLIGCLLKREQPSNNIHFAARQDTKADSPEPPK